VIYTGLLLTAACSRHGPLRLSAEPTCLQAEQLASSDPDPAIDIGVATAALLTQASSVGAVVNRDLRVTFPPAVVAAYQELRPGETATWEVAALQLPDRARQLTVAFDDSAANATMEIPIGTGACMFKVERTYADVGQRTVRFTVVDAPSTSNGGDTGEGPYFSTVMINTR